MWEKIYQIFKVKEIRNKILYVVGILVVFRLFASIPIPGIDVDQIKAYFEGSQIFGMINLFSGGALSQMSLMMLGVGPYVTSSIILQLLTMIFPSLKEMYQEGGEAGRRKFNQYTRILTVPLALLQAYSLIVILQRQNLLGALTPLSIAFNIIVATAGSILLMWLGELISEKSIGNGISLLIFAGIVAGLPQDLKQLITTYDPSQIPSYVAFLAITVIVVGGVVFITEAQRNVPVAYAKRIRGNRVYGGSSTYLPIRVNQAGMIPIIFALSLLLFPNILAGILSATPIPWLANFARSMQVFFQNQLVYGMLYFVLVVAFTYFYTAIVFDPKAIAENMQKQGGFIPGIRPGASTMDYLSHIIRRITFWGAVFLGTVAVIPLVVQYATNFKTLTIGGTAILIVVAVLLDSMQQIDSQLTMREYEGF
ncbi:MAG: preprotein translocase subunit SecY [Patescibacteria group bacterium]